jgi:hypothetical protein
MRWTSLLVSGFVIAAAVATGCGDNGANVAADADVATDAAITDAALVDASPPDASPPDAAPCANPLPGLGGECLSTPVGVTTPSAETPNAEIAWTGTEFAIAWVDRDAGGARRIYVTRVDATGAPLGTTQMSEGSGDVNNPAIAWSGAELGVTWTTSSNDVYFVRATAAGDRIGTPAQISEAAANAQGIAIAWSGDRYGLAWHDGRDGNSEIYFAALDAMGVKLTADVRVTNTAARSWTPSMVWTGTGFAIVYREDTSSFSGRVNLALVDATGAGAGGTPISDVAAWIDGPALAWNGSQLVVVWDDNRATDQELYLQYLDGSGVEQGSDVRITMTTTYSDDAVVAWNGSTYRVAWQENIEPGPFGLDVADLDTVGTKLTGDVELVQSGLSPAMARLFWIGDRYAVFWQVPLAANMRQLMYATLTPP